MKNVDLSIIIVSYNTQDLTLACLTSIFAETKRSFEVILVDNDSKDQTIEAVGRKFPSVHIIANKTNAGFAKAVNQGVDVSRGRYVLLFNSDAEVINQALDKMVEYMDKHPQIGILGPKLLHRDGSLQPSAQHFPSLKYLLYDATFLSRLLAKSHEFGGFRQTDVDHRQSMETDKVMGSAFLIRREVIEQVGRLDERFFMYYEETDFCLRVKRAGWKVYYWTGAEVMHIWNGSSKTINPVVVRHSLESMSSYFAKQFGMVAAVVANGLTLMGAVVSWLALAALGLLKRDKQGLNTSRQWNAQVVRFYLRRPGFWVALATCALSLTVVLDRIQLSQGYASIYLYHPFILIVILLGAWQMWKLPHTFVWTDLYRNRSFVLFVIFVVFNALALTWTPVLVDGLRALVKLSLFVAMAGSIVVLLWRRSLVLAANLGWGVLVSVGIIIFGLVQMVLWWNFGQQNFFLGTMWGRPNAGFTEPDWFGIYLAAVTAGVLAYQSFRARISFGVLAVLLLLFFGVFLSSSRSATLSLVISALIIAAVLWWRLKWSESWRRMAKLAVISVAGAAVSLAVVCVAMPQDYEYLISRFTAIPGFREVGIASRLSLAQQAAQVVSTSAAQPKHKRKIATPSAMVATPSAETTTQDTAQVGMLFSNPQRLLFGFGMGSWGHYLGLKERGIPYGGGAFNFLISLAFELGAVGLVLFLVFWLALVFQLVMLQRLPFKTDEERGLALIALVIPIQLFVSGMFSNTYLVAFTWFFYAISISIMLLLRNRYANRH